MVRIAPTLFLVLAACEVGSFPKGGSGTSDATPTGDDGAIPIDAQDFNACVDRTVPPEGAHVHAANGTTRAGEACSNGTACHAADSANPWLASGTVYNTAGNAIQAGVLVRIQQGTGTPLRAVTDDAGNFHIQDLGQTPIFPAKIEVTACLNAPEMQSMGAMAMTKADLNCTRTGGGCHDLAAQQINF